MGNSVASRLNRACSPMKLFVQSKEVFTKCFSQASQMFAHRCRVGQESTELGIFTRESLRNIFCLFLNENLVIVMCCCFIEEKSHNSGVPVMNPLPY